jgi:hypothetical protein
MYPPVTQFETRHQMILDELRVREARRLARRSTPRIPRATLPMRLARLLKARRPSFEASCPDHRYMRRG